MRYHLYNFHGITRTKLEKVIDEYVVGYKAERNRILLKRRVCDGMTYEDLAEEMDMSVRQVKKICYAYESVICEHIWEE